MQYSDDVRLVMGSRELFPLREPPMQIVLDATAPTSSPNWIGFSLESNASIANAEQEISLYNFAAGRYEVLDTRLATSADGEVDVYVATDATRFIQPFTLGVRARISYRALSRRFERLWLGRIDRARWTFSG